MPHAAPGRVAALVAALGLFAAPAWAQPIFKWVDANGRTHYGEKPPDGVKAVPIEAPTPPSVPTTQSDSPQRWKDAERAFREERLEKERREKAAASQDARAQGQRAARCREAKVALDRLNNVQGLYRYDAKGERVYYTDAEREAEARVYRQRMKDNCD